MWNAKVSILTMLAIVLSLTAFPCLGGLHGDVELLKTVALTHKANFESLMTWKGEAFEELIATCENPRKDYMLRNKCTFAYDKSQNAARWNKEPQEHRHVVEGKEVHWEKIRFSYNSGMVKGKCSYKYFVGGERDGKDVFSLVVDHLKGPRSLGIFTDDTTLEPGYFFADCGAGGPMYDRLMWMYNNADLVKASSGNVLYLKRAGNLVTVEFWMPKQKCTQKYVFDLSVGGNLIEYLNEYSKAETVVEFQYEQMSEVWIPKSYNYKNITGKQKGSGAQKSSRMIRWSNSVVNVPFEENEFTVDKLGVKPGDKVSNWIINDSYKYGDFPAGFEEGPVSLVGKRLPSLEQIGAKLNPAELEDKRILVCFWDMNQRPSRHMMRELAKRAEKLKEKGVAVVCVQASKVERGKLDEWAKENKIPFEVGMIEGDAKQVSFKWGVKSLPWLILTDEKHVVQGEGLSIRGVDERFKIEISADRGRRRDSTIRVWQMAPDFELPRLLLGKDSKGKRIGKISSEKVKLSSFRGKKPVCLIFSSYT